MRKAVESYGVSLPDPFWSIYGGVRKPADAIEIAGYSTLTADEIEPLRRVCGYPDFIPLLRKQDVVVGVLVPILPKDDLRWVSFSYEVGASCADLGRSAISALRALIVECEESCILRDEVDPSVEFLRASIRELLSNHQWLAEGMAPALIPQRFSRRAFGYEGNSYVLGTRLIPREHRIPYFECVDAQHFWVSAQIAEALRIWSGAQSNSPMACSSYYGAGVALAAMGATAEAIAAFTGLLQADWRTLQPTLGSCEAPWSVIVANVYAFLRQEARKNLLPEPWRRLFVAESLMEPGAFAREATDALRTKRYDVVRNMLNVLASSVSTHTAEVTGELHNVENDLYAIFGKEHLLLS